MRSLGTDVRDLLARLEPLNDPDSLAPGEFDNLLTDGYAHALALDAERLKLEQRIAELAARAHEPEAAQQLRKLWLRHRTLVPDLQELRRMLGQVQRSRD